MLLLLCMLLSASFFLFQASAYPSLPISPTNLPIASSETLSRYRIAQSEWRKSSRSLLPYCKPTDSCWPTPQELSIFNETVSGRLLSIYPEGLPCFIDPSSPLCENITGMWTDPVWRAAQPGSMQRPFWEADRETGANCYTPGGVCSQGDVPPMGVAAETAQDVALALSFAASHNLQIVIKATGHDIQGRSTAANSFLIWTARLKNITFHEAYIACEGDVPSEAISAGPGDSYGELYALLDPSYIVVGGSARTVSAAGGHVLGGGHSFISPHYGLAADNILSAVVVLANSSIVRASSCENPDLFWALRGGGGGSFGVLTEVTHKIHKTPSVITGIIFEVALLQGIVSVDMWLNGALALSPSLLNTSTTIGGGIFGGYHNVQPVASSPGLYVWIAIFGYNGTVDDTKSSLSGFRALVASQPSHFYLVNESYTPFNSWESWHQSFDPIDTGDRTGSDSTIGCRFVPLQSALDPVLRANASAALASLVNYVPLLGHLVAGGAVAAFDRDSTQTSVTPAWRDAVWHMCIGAGFDSSANITTQNNVIMGVSELTGALREAIPNSGAYFNEADLLEPDWQESFFGIDNYKRLQLIKKSVDPNGLFNCWHCVEQLPTL